MKKGKHISHGIEFLFLFGINGMMLWFFRGYLYLVIAIAMILLFVSSFLSVHIVKKHLAVKIHMPDICMPKNTEFLVKISVCNTSWIPVYNGWLDMTVGNVFMAESSPMQLNIPLRAKGTTEVEVPVTAEQVGVVEVVIRGIVLEDWLGCHSITKKVEEKDELYVIPEGICQERVDANAYETGMEEVEESKLKGNDFSDVSQVREYIPGDAMKNIHWKLSAKKDEMMVKERLRMSTGKLLLLLALEREDVKKADETLERLYGMGKELIRQNVPISLYFWSEKTKEMMEESAESQEEWRQVMIQVLFHHAGNGGIEEQFRRMNPQRSYVLINRDGISQREV